MGKKLLTWIPWNLSFRYILFHEKRLQTMLWHHNAWVNSHQRWKQTRFRVCFHLWCELTIFGVNVREWQVSWNSYNDHRRNPSSVRGNGLTPISIRDSWLWSLGQIILCDEVSWSLDRCLLAENEGIWVCWWVCGCECWWMCWFSTSFYVK